MRRRICVISLALPIESDPRTLRQVEYLSKQYDITLIGYGKFPAHLSNVIWKPVDRSMSRVRLIYEYLLLLIGRLIPAAYQLWLKTRPRYQQALTYALEADADAYHASDWATLYVAVEATRKHSAKVVFDADEYWPQSNEMSHLWNLFFAPLIRYVLHECAPHVAMTINVSQPIAERYKAEYGLDYILVYNVPDLQTVPAHEIAPDHIRLIHHGSAVADRQLEIMIQTMPLLDQRFTLDLMLVPSDPTYFESLKAQAKALASERITFRKTTPLAQVVQAIADCDIGFCLVAPSNYSYEMSMPNKLFEFIMAGLGVLAGPSPAMAQVVQQYGVGWVAPSFKPEDLAATLNALTVEQIQQAKTAALEAAKSLNAEQEIGKILALYQQLLEPLHV